MNRSVLWHVLCKNGIKGRMLRALKAMYRSVRTCVRVNGKLSDSFACPSGLKQGENSSTILFSFFINELGKEIIRQGIHGVQMQPNEQELFLLLFADDLVLISGTPKGLQNQLNILERESNKLNLVVNIDKTNIVVFRRGGRTRKCENWTFNGSSIRITNKYKYLGYVFTSKLSMNVALKEAAIKAKSKIVSILRVMSRIGCANVTIFTKLYEAQVQSGLCYASEIWGLEKADVIERIQLFAFKRCLRVNLRTPNIAIYGDTGRTPLYITTCVRAVKYWLRLLLMDEDRLPKKAYAMSLGMADNNVSCWALRIRSILCTYGFGEIWYNQGVGDKTQFLKLFRRRLDDCYKQNWASYVTNSNRLHKFALFKNQHYAETYIDDIPVPARTEYIRFRMGVSDINCHSKRYSSNVNDSMLCPLCGQIENEEHFLFECTRYDSFRPTFLKCERSMYNIKFLHVMKYTKRKCCALAWYIFKALKLRRELTAS